LEKIYNQILVLFNILNELIESRSHQSDLS